MFKNSRLFLPFLLTGVAYARSYSGSFQYDDFSAILENPHLADGATFIAHLGHMVRPVLQATFFADRAWFGTDPTGYHLLNLLLHMGSGILLYLIFARAVANEDRQLSCYAALLFLVHPIQTEAVTYISGRASGLMAFCYLLAFFLYIKASESPHGGSLRRIYLLGALAAAFLSIASPETTVACIKRSSNISWNASDATASAKPISARFGVGTAWRGLADSSRTATLTGQ